MTRSPGISTKPHLRVRQSIQELQHDYESHEKEKMKPLEDLMRAWKAIKDLPAEDPHSFFTLGGYHGEPFRGAGWGSSAYWGGYCNHGDVLFPAWHGCIREAGRGIAECPRLRAGDVTLLGRDQCRLSGEWYSLGTHPEGLYAGWKNHSQSVAFVCLHQEH